MAALSQLHGKVDNADMFYEKGLILEDGKLMHLFWVNGTSRIDYEEKQKCLNEFGRTMK